MKVHAVLTVNVLMILETEEYGLTHSWRKVHRLTTDQPDTGGLGLGASHEAQCFNL